MLQTGGAGGLSSSRQAELLKSVDQDTKTFQTAATARFVRWLRLDMLLLQADSSHTPQAVLRFCGVVVLGSTVSILALTRIPLLALTISAVLGSTPWLWLRARGKKRMAAMNKVLPQVLDMMSRSLRAGHSLPAALGIVAEEAAEPAHSAFGDVFQKQKFGLPLRDALLELVLHFPSEDLKVLVTAILVQQDTGGNLVQILDRTSAVIRERLKLQGDVRVHTAQGRLTGWILCLLPVLMLLMLMVTNPSYVKVLTDDSLGRKLMYGGVILLGVGAVMIQRIVKKIEV